MHVNKKKKIKKFVTSPVSFPCACACACLSRRIRGGFKGGRGARLQYAEGKARPYPRPCVCVCRSRSPFRAICGAFVL